MWLICCTRTFFIQFLTLFKDVESLWYSYFEEEMSDSVRVTVYRLLILVLAHFPFCVGRDGVVSIETRYRLDSSGFESRWVRCFSHSPERPWDPRSLL